MTSSLIERVTERLGDFDLDSAGPHYERNLRDAAEAAIKAMPGWEPIETAPKDGTAILLFSPQSIQDDDALRPFYQVSRWVVEIEDLWVTIDDTTQKRMPHDNSHWENWEIPTHWMPLPTSPAPDTKDSAKVKP